MTGQELAKLKESRVFRAPVMDTIINEFVPATNAFVLTDAFLPFKEVDKTVMIDMINHGAFGRTNPINLGADHKRIALPGNSYKEHTGGHWREAVQFDEGVLAKAVDPAKPTERYGEGLVTSSLNLLDLRLNTLIESVSAKVIINGKYSEARYGVNYEYDPSIPAKHFKDITSTPGWVTGGTWATLASSTPIADMMGVQLAMFNMGLTPQAVYMSQNTLEKFYLSADTKTIVGQSPSLVEKSANRKVVFDTLVGLPVERDNRLYAEETRLVAASPAADTTLEVASAADFVAGETLILRNTLGEEEEVVIDTGGITGNIITLTAGVSNAYLAGDRVTVHKQYLPDGYVVIKAETIERLAANNWLSTPSLVKGAGWNKPMPGRYTWTYFQEKVPYLLEVGAGIDGGPKVSKCNWVTLKVW
jgi:hypothetical protein